MVLYVNVETKKEVKTLEKAKSATKRRLRGDEFQTEEWGKVDSFEMVVQTILINGAGQVVERI